MEKVRLIKHMKQQHPQFWSVSFTNDKDGVDVLCKTTPKSFTTKQGSYRFSLMSWTNLVSDYFSWFLFKGQWTYAPTLCLWIDTHIRSHTMLIPHVKPGHVQSLKREKLKIAEINVIY